MRKCFIVLLILVLPALLAACFPAAGINVQPEAPATGLATLQPALAPGTAAATGTAEGTGSPAAGAASTPGPASLPTSGTLTLSATAPTLEGATAMPEPTGAASGVTPPAVSVAIAGAAQQLGVKPDALALIAYEAVDWPDACMGIALPGIMCAQVITPGYRIVLKGPQGEFEVHTGAAGTPARLLKPGTPGGLPSTAPAPTPQAAAPSAKAAPVNNSGASGIEGRVTIGPITPAAREGQSNSRPYQATIDVLDQSGQIVTRFGTNARGLFRVALAPGTYVIHPESAGRFPRAAQKTVRVLPGAFVTVDIEYDSGIR